MVSKDIVVRTMQAIEDYMDAVATLQLEGVAQVDMAALNELLNFWRLYNNFSTEEDAING